jgi:SAM-dependent methyltransferase
VSVLDIGCGIGTWLRVFQDLGTHDVRGVDGDYVNQNALLIDSSRFTSHDLEQPLHLGRCFDLVVSLEVGEHLHRRHAQTYVDSIVRHANRVLFSAAIPGQGGTNHVNEQWPEYWIELFASRGFRCLDPFRQKFWHEHEIDACYRQNLLLFAEASKLDQDTTLCHTPEPPLGWSLVHPQVFREITDRPVGMRRIIRDLPISLVRSLRARLPSRKLAMTRRVRSAPL